MRRALLGALAAGPVWGQAPLRMTPSEEQRRLAIALMDAIGIQALLDDMMRLMAVPVMQRQREATLGQRWLTPLEWIEIRRLQWREPVLQRLVDETAAIRKDMVDIGNETLDRIAEAAVRKHINTLRYNGFRT